MKILVACECYGIVRDAFLKKGHNVWSCDIKVPKTKGPHIRGNVLDILDSNWDMMLAFPPCTHLALSGARWFKEKKLTGKQQAAIDFFMALAEAPIEKICIENPVGIMSKVWRRPTQTIQPWEFGHDAQKRTCLWLKNLPPLRKTKIVQNPAWVPCSDCEDFWCTLHNEHVYDCECPGVEEWAEKGLWPYENGGRYANQTPAGNSKLGNVKNRGEIKSITYQGIADAMANQWG